jgi:hypothetical protein
MCTRGLLRIDVVGEFMHPLSLQCHFRVLTKFAHVESLFFGHKRQREVGFPEEYAKFLAAALPWIISGIGASHLLMPLTT